MAHHIDDYDPFFTVTTQLFPVVAAVFKMICEFGSLQQHFTFGMNAMDFSKFTDIFVVLTMLYLPFPLAAFVKTRTMEFQ